MCEDVAIQIDKQEKNAALLQGNSHAQLNTSTCDPSGAMCLQVCEQ